MRETDRREFGDTASHTARGVAGPEQPDVDAGRGIERMPVSLTVNGRTCTIMVEPRMTLLDALREELALTGTKKGCDRGECGACTVHVEGRRVLSCMTLAAMQEASGLPSSRGWSGTASFTRFRRRSSSMTASNAVSVRPGRLCRASP
jgi:xanthine dehydrogenase YagT iron-sulfur-binding subunit